jgi:hypothetical protein
MIFFYFANIVKATIITRILNIGGKILSSWIMAKSFFSLQNLIFKHIGCKKFEIGANKSLTRVYP